MNGNIMIRGIIILVMLVGFSGCTDVDVNESVQFSISLFYVQPSIISSGEFANLSWVVIGAETVSIDQGIGNVTISGKRSIQPSETVTYTITACNKSKILTARTEIIVLTNETDDENSKITNETNFENVYLDSDIVCLVYANFSFDKQRQIADVEYRLENIAEREIIFDVTVQFYDDLDFLIGYSDTHMINLPNNYTQLENNEARYQGEKAEDISYACIIIKEI